MKSGDRIEVIGYGHLSGERREAVFIGLEASRVILGFWDENDARQYEVPFRKADGVVIKGEISGGYLIPKNILDKLKGIVAPAANPLSGKPRAGNSSAIQTPARRTPTGRGNANMATTKAKPAAAPAKAASAPATAKKNGKTTAAAAPVETPAETPKGKNGTAKPAATAPKAAPKAAPKPAAVKPSDRATPAAATVSKPPAAAAPAGNSPMEQAARHSKVGEGELLVNLSPLMYRQITFDEIRGQEGRKTPGFASFRKAFESAAERSYVYIVMNEAGAKFLVCVAFVNGFKGAWKGSLTGGFKRQAKRTAETICAHYGFAVPQVIADYTGGESRKPKAAPRRTRTPAVAPAAAKPAGKPKPAAAVPTPANKPQTAKPKPAVKVAPKVGKPKR